MAKKEFTQISLPKDIDMMEEMKVWKMAFSANYGKEVSF